MRIDILTLFPDMCRSVASESIIGRAVASGAIEVYCHDIRDYTLDKHRKVDDYPYGGGQGMILQCDPLYRCWEAVKAQAGEKAHTVFMSPAGAVFTQRRCVELSKLENIILVCGHYEGVDERVVEEIVDEEISIGDYVITGGELAALVVMDAVARMCDGVLSQSAGYEEESHYSGLLEYPQYTRPEEWHGRRVPDILLSGHHANIEQWRREQSLERTKERRGDMYERYVNKEN